MKIMIVLYYEPYLYDLKASKWLYLDLATFGRFWHLLTTFSQPQIIPRMWLFEPFSGQNAQ